MAGHARASARGTAEDLPGERAGALGIEAGGYLRLSVADTGTGTDAATLARASRPCFTSRPKGRGTGLGLSMADRFAAQSGGALGIESAMGAGTTVTPWLRQTAEGGEAAPVEGPDAGRETPRRRALVVDDAPVMRRFLRDCRPHEGWRTRAGMPRKPADAAGPGWHRPHPGSARSPERPAVLLSGPERGPCRSTLEREVIPVLRKPASPLELVAFLEALTRQAAC